MRTIVAALVCAAALTGCGGADAPTLLDELALGCEDDPVVQDEGGFAACMTVDGFVSVTTDLDDPGFFVAMMLDEGNEVVLIGGAVVVSPAEAVAERVERHDGARRIRTIQDL